MKILLEDLKKIVELCKKFKKPMPTEMKLDYNINEQSLNAKYKYEPVYSMAREITVDDIERSWFEEVKNN